MACWAISRRLNIPRRARLACNVMAIAALAQVINYAYLAANGNVLDAANC